MRPPARLALLPLCLLALAACDQRPATPLAGERSHSPWEQAAGRGVDFRAVGQEPGWVLEIQEGQSMMFAGDYGETRVSTPAAQRHDEGQGRVRHEARAYDGQAVVALIETTPCQDIMSGEEFPQRVVVRHAGREHHGCGRYLSSAR